MKSVYPPPLYAVHLQEPSDIDSYGQNSSSSLPPAQVSVPAGSLSGLGQTAKVADTGPATGSAVESGTQSAPGALNAADVTPQTVSVYTPAQIKQAYGFSALPAPTVANKMAYQGSGQTIIIVDAFHNPTASADVNTFSLKFGIPTCALLPTTFKAGTPIASLVTKPAAGSNCAFQVLYATSSGAQAAAPPPANDSWATEIALDVQWAHAVAPRAKIVLVEAASNSGSALMNAMVFARNLQGSSVISMSFGSPEFSSGPSYDYIMTGAGITWVASSGDSGAGTSWPATSANVLGVGGTALSNVSPRAETAWDGSGGGRALYVPMPGWQSTVTIAGNTAGSQHRAVPDVAYNASPYSGFYIFRSGHGYLSVGGTSAGAPQWAGLVAVFNGVRALAGKAPLNSLSLHQALYNTAAKAANYPANFLDVTSGSDGACASCSAAVGYDLVTGLGTPNVVALVKALAAL
jgi:subtilase family serine protease